MQRGEVIFERYAPGRTASQTHYEASLTKALVGGMSPLLALNGGRIAVDDLASKYIETEQIPPCPSVICSGMGCCHLAV